MKKTIKEIKESYYEHARVRKTATFVINFQNSPKIYFLIPHIICYLLTFSFLYLQQLNLINDTSSLNLQQNSLLSIPPNIFPRLNNC